MTQVNSLFCSDLQHLYVLLSCFCILSEMLKLVKKDVKTQTEMNKEKNVQVMYVKGLKQI